MDTASNPKLNVSIPATLEAGKYYTVFTYDTLATPKFKLVNDDIQQPSDTSSRIRFANLVQAPITNVEIYSQNGKANVFSNIASTDVTPFKQYPSKLIDTFYVRSTGSVVNLATLIFTPGEKRSYTVLFKGRFTTTSGTLVRTLTLMTNY